jgi:chromate transporter
MGIFLPSFFYVGLLAPVLFRLRQSIWIAAFLDSVNVSAVALMVGVTVRLGFDALRGWPAWLIAVASLLLLLRWKISAAWIVLGGGVAGFLLAFVR